MKQLTWTLLMLSWVILLSGCASSQIKMRENLKEVDYAISGIQLAPSSSTGLVLWLDLELSNTLGESMVLDSIESSIQLNGRPVGSLNHLNHVKIAPGESQVVRFEVNSQLGMMDWFQFLKSLPTELEVELQGKAWSQVEYLGFWDSMKETDFQFRKSFPSQELKTEISKMVQGSIQKTLGLPGAILDPFKKQKAH